ncbi:uncharacterized protein PAF06_013858 [Gastrophryne carolinensis]
MFSFDRCKRGNQGFQRVLIQLFGHLGHGKSSFINTCIYVWTGDEYQNWAKARGSDGGATMDRVPHQLTNNIFLVDNRGCSKMEACETGEIFAQLGNLLPLGDEVEWSKGFGLSKRIVEAEKLVKSSDFIMPVYVHSVKHIIPDEDIKEFKALLHTARDLTGVYPIVVLTHKTFGNLTTVESQFKDMGVERIFAFENYTREDHFKTRGRHEEVLRFLQEVIKDAQFRVEHQDRNPAKELCDRKQFVLNYIHKQEKKREQQEIERKRALEQVEKEKELRKQQEEMERERQRMRKVQDEELRKKKAELEWKRLENKAKMEDEMEAQKAANDTSRGFWGMFKKKNNKKK